MSGALLQGSTDTTVVGFFVASGLGATGLTVTIDVHRFRSGSWSEIVTGGSATELADGLYYYTISNSSVAAGDVFAYVFKTAGTADQKNVGGMVRIETNFTATISGRVDAAISTRSTLTAANVWDYLSASATTVGSLGKRLVDYLTGDIFGRVGAPAGASVSADIAAIKSDTGGLVTAVADVPTNAELTTALDPIATAAELSAAQAAIIADTGATETAILAAVADVPSDTLALFAAQTVVVRTPVATERSITIYIGDSYRAADDRALEWDIGDSPDLTGFTLSSTIAGVAISTCSITGAGTASQILVVEPTAAETATMPRGMQDFSVIATNTTPNPDATITLVYGKANCVVVR